MKVTKTVEVTQCPQCPYFDIDHDMHATLYGCELKGEAYDMIFDNDSWHNGIYNECPYRKRGNKNE